MLKAAPALWSFFLASVISVTIVVIAFAAALVIAQRQRASLRQRYAQRVLRAHDDERAWVAAELHDSALQRVALIRSELDGLWESLADSGAPADPRRLQSLNDEIVDLGVELRGLARRLHPTVVDHLGLPRALQALAQEMQHGGGLLVSVEAPSEDGLALRPEVARAAYRVAQEALRNVARHAGVREASVRLVFSADSIVLSVRDRGRGFDAASRLPSDRLGLATIEARALSVGGTAVVKSRPGAGTVVEVTLPREVAP